ncbi:TIGR03086 family metal-binding protein [Streptomyces sp. NPDC059909]|uniref:TIGR03086 family metal-binding protein n=1 Tax=Streptomyces sp. NPDC059909 TaxID=3346998 RepID=UPI003661EABB
MPTRMHAPMHELATAVAETARAVRPDQLGDRTPCEKFTVAELLGHLGAALADSERAARRQPRPKDGQPSVSYAPEDVAAVALGATAAWADPAAYEGTTVFGPGEMPAEFAAAITLEELALHGWDLARATGRTFPVGAGTQQAVLGIVEQIAEQARSNGGYGPPRVAPADASPFDHALATSGRDPHWA